MRALTHPQFVHHLVDFYPQRGTVQTATITRNVMNEEVKTWANKAGHVNISCALASPRGGTAATTEIRQSGMTFARENFDVGLFGYFAAIKPTERILIDDVTYDILGVEHDTQHRATRLKVERIV